MVPDLTSSGAGTRGGKIRHWRQILPNSVYGAFGPRHQPKVSIPKLLLAVVVGAIELFAGCGVFSSRLKNNGCITETVDFIYDPVGQDLSVESVIRSYEVRLARGEFDIVHFGTECRTFSRGCHPPHRDGSNLFVMPGLSEEKLQIAQTGTKLVETTVRLWAAALHGSKRTGKRVFMSWENPAESLMWELPCTYKVQNSCNAGTGNNTVLCYCRYGKKFWKRTRFFTTFDFSSLGLMCQCKEKHPEVLRGRNNAAGMNWAAYANAYPRRLVNRWVELILSKYNRVWPKTHR